MTTAKLVPKKRHCWHHAANSGHVLAAEELAGGLKKVRVGGIGLPKELDPVNYKSQIAGKTGIIFSKITG